MQGLKGEDPVAIVPEGQNEDNQTKIQLFKTFIIASLNSDLCLTPFH